METPRMATADEFEDRPTLLKYLGEQLFLGRLTPVLGAGISTSFGLPDWPELLRRLYLSKGVTAPSESDLARQAQDFRLRYYQRDFCGFLDAVRSALYQGVAVDFERIRASATLDAIASLVMASLRGNTSEIITFNWDDLLEIYFKYHGGGYPLHSRGRYIW